MSSFWIKGTVQSRFTNISNSYPNEINLLIACKNTSPIGVESLDRFFGLTKGTSAPYFFEILIIFLSSVETITCEKSLDEIAFSIVCAIRGFLPKTLIFLLGTP